MAASRGKFRTVLRAVVGTCRLITLRSGDCAIPLVVTAAISRSAEPAAASAP